MTRTPVLEAHFLADPRRLDPRDRSRILDAVERWAATGHGDVRQLRGQHDVWRFRVGKWRAFFDNSRPAAPRFYALDNRGQAY